MLVLPDTPGIDRVYSSIFAGLLVTSRGRF